MRGDDEVLRAVKFGSYIQVSDELLMDQGLIPDTRPPVPPPPWRTRLCWWVEGRRERVGEIIAGRRFDETGEW
jgi:hypothetical protein